jgi:hypothetical protein
MQAHLHHDNGVIAHDNGVIAHTGQSWHRLAHLAYLAHLCYTAHLAYTTTQMS